MRARVVLVDVDVEARTRLAERLRRNRDRIELVGVAPDAVEAAPMLEEGKVDVVLLDLHKADGFTSEPCRGIRQLTQAPIAVLASFMTQPLVADLRKAGATALILKRVDSGALAARLSQLGSDYRMRARAPLG